MTAITRIFLFALFAALISSVMALSADNWADSVAAEDKAQAQHLQGLYKPDQHYVSLNLPQANQISVHYLDEKDQPQASATFVLTRQLKEAYVRLVNQLAVADGQQPMSEADILSRYHPGPAPSGGDENGEDDNKTTKTGVPSKRAVADPSGQLLAPRSRCGGFCRNSAQCPRNCRHCWAVAGFRYSKRCARF